MLAELVGRTDLARALRRTMLVVLVVGLVGLVGLAFLGQPFAGLGLCVGLAAGILNVRMIGASVTRVAALDHPKPRKPLAANTALRLAFITAVALVLLVVASPVGVGMLIGLICFQFSFLANLAWAVYRRGALS